MVEATERELDERGGERRKRMMKTIMEKGSRNGRGRKEEKMKGATSIRLKGRKE